MCDVCVLIVWCFSRHSKNWLEYLYVWIFVARTNEVEPKTERARFQNQKKRELMKKIHTHKINQYLYIWMRIENETKSGCKSLNDTTTTFERIFMMIWPIQIWKSHGHTYTYTEQFKRTYRQKCWKYFFWKNVSIIFMSVDDELNQIWAQSNGRWNEKRKWSK